MATNTELKAKELLLTNVRRTGKQLGRGSFGVVEELMVEGTICAGKTLHSELQQLREVRYNEYEQIIKRFTAECILLCKLRHPRIIQFLGVCFLDDSRCPTLVMEKLDSNLESVLKAQKNIPFPLIVCILQDVAEGLSHLHSQKPPIIHRDLTASNVLVHKASLRAKIADSGNMIEHTETSDTCSYLSGAPGMLSYMPPEALVPGLNPKYDTMVDIFSYGHLSLFAVLQEFPGDLLHSVYHDNVTSKVHVRSEVERREKYFQILYGNLSEDHMITKMITKCLDNNPEKRLTATKIVGILGVCMEGDTCSQFDPFELVIGNRSQSNLYNSILTYTDSLKCRIDELKEGAPGVLDIKRLHGKAKLSRKRSWRRHVFQIKDSSLMYYKQDMMDAPHDVLDLALVVGVKTCPPSETSNWSMFCFEVHFSKVKGSPWLLRACTQDDQKCWMEAILTGSSADCRLVSTENRPPNQSTIVLDNCITTINIPESGDLHIRSSKNDHSYDYIVDFKDSELTTTEELNLNSEETPLSIPPRSYTVMINQQMATNQCVSSSVRRYSGTSIHHDPKPVPSLETSTCSTPEASDFEYEDVEAYTSERKSSKESDNPLRQTFEVDLPHIVRGLFLTQSANCHVLEIIGHGNFGKVYKGVCRYTGGSELPVAIKSTTFKSEDEREEFQKGMSIISKLIHPNIVHCSGVVQQLQETLVILEYLCNGDLKTFLTEHERSVKVLHKYLLDIATGMMYISEKGLVHRDLAARNVMVNEDEICKVGDFGLLREVSTDDYNVYVSTKEDKERPIRWMAPESIKNKAYSTASDVWSFGVVMWEIVNPKEMPYKDLTNMEVAIGVHTGNRLNIPSCYPPTSANIMKACWKRQPTNRPTFSQIALFFSVTLRAS